VADRMFAVAIADGGDLFLWMRLRRASAGDVYYMNVIKERRWVKQTWNPHGSLHKCGQLHHKSYNRKFGSKKGSKPDHNFKDTINFCYTPIASGYARARNVICSPSKFSDVMIVPEEMLRPIQYETYISLDLTGQNGPESVNTADGEILLQKRFADSVPNFLVSVILKPLPAELRQPSSRTAG
jgi:hypothetical protein